MTLVIKLSGKVLEKGPLRLALQRQIAQLSSQGHRILVVHGGGKQLSETCRRLTIPNRQYQGRRVTDQATLDVAKMVFSSINRDLVSGLLACGAKAIGTSSFDLSVVKCRKRAPIRLPEVGERGESPTIDFGLIAEIEHIDPSALFRFWEWGWVPVMNCLCADSEGQILNINADTLAGEMALAVEATRLLSVSDVQGIYRDPGDASTQFVKLGAQRLRTLLDQGCFTHGMIPKIQVALRVLEGGVRAVHVLSGSRRGSLLQALDGKEGTVLVA